MQNAGRGVKIKERKVEEEKRVCTCKCRFCAIYMKSMDAGTGSGGSRLETQGGPMGKKFMIQHISYQLIIEIQDINKNVL
jgi:hypothetical protein